jgi:hypothetical protein
MLVLAASAVAQQYQIMRAEYGTGDRWADVTQKVRDKARGDMTFRMGKNTFDVDPAPGQRKMLRIFARDNRGQERTFEYRDGDVVDGAMFADWRDNNPGRNDTDEGQFRILHARYGIAGANVDVTQRLRELARQDRTFRMGNSTFGVDPAPGRAKMLRIFARDRDGQRRMFEYREGAVIDGAMFTGWGGGEWGRDPWDGNWGDNDDDDRPGRGGVRFGRDVMEIDFGGGPGGQPSPDAMCPAGSAAVGFHVQTGSKYNQTWLDCAEIRPDGTLESQYRSTSRTGAPGGQAIHDARCRPGSVLRGLKGRTGSSIDEASGVCSSARDIFNSYDSRRVELTNPIRRPDSGGSPAEAQCPSGSVMVGLRSRSGAWMDHLWILCSEVRRGY